MQRAVLSDSTPLLASTKTAAACAPRAGSYVSAIVSERIGTILSLHGQRYDAVPLRVCHVAGAARMSRQAPAARAQVLDDHPQRTWSFASYTWVIYLGFLLSVLAYYIWVSYLTLSWPIQWLLIKLRALRGNSRSTSTNEAAVQLYVYDLSNGLAQQMSPVLLNKQIDGIWHTAIVVGGLEYYYGAGISQSGPGLTPFGKPLKVIDLGCTCIPRGRQEAYLRELQMVYTAQAYSLFRHNCNHFTNDFATFLTGSGIPGHILALPEELLATPFGQMLAPMLSPLEQRLGTIRQQPAGTQPAVPFKEQQLAAALTPDRAQVFAFAAAHAVPAASAKQAMSAVQLSIPASETRKAAALSVPAFVKDAKLGEATLSSGSVNSGPVVKLAAKDIVKATGLTAWLRLYAARRLLRRKRRERRHRQSLQQQIGRA